MCPGVMRLTPIGSIFCRCSRGWVRRFTGENYVIKIEDLKNFSAETSGVTTISPHPIDYEQQKLQFFDERGNNEIYFTKRVGDRGSHPIGNLHRVLPTHRFS